MMHLSITYSHGKCSGYMIDIASQSSPLQFESEMSRFGMASRCWLVQQMRQITELNLRNKLRTIKCIKSRYSNCWFSWEDPSLLWEFFALVSDGCDDLPKIGHAYLPIEFIPHLLFLKKFRRKIRVHCIVLPLLAFWATILPLNCLNQISLNSFRLTDDKC